ncbi:MAG: metallophosphoesterase [candidate division Zixibacteria bacterium]|nr:metallophosphoesterase [candidate division Zixibacteria bacterium]
MRTLFIGDLHGCAEPFRRLLDTLSFDSATDRLFLTGDAFTKGPDPAGVWRLIGETGATMVLGNHDVNTLEWLREYVRGRQSDVRTPDGHYTVDALSPVAGPVFNWLKSLPLWIEEDRFLLVHAGINPEKGLKNTSRDEFLAIRTWPPTGGLVGPRWHDALPTDGKLIVFGHDAPGGLVVKRRTDGTPYVIGLDSGCVYGRSLSGYILEEDRIIQVDRV